MPIDLTDVYIPEIYYEPAHLKEPAPMPVNPTKTKRVVYQEDYESGPFKFSGRLIDLLSGINECWQQIPEADRPDAIYQIGGTTDDDNSPSAFFRLDYKVPKTPNEIKREEEYLAKANADYERRQREQYEELRRKFETEVGAVEKTDASK